MNRKQLRRELQRELGKYLPSWSVRKGLGLYRLHPHFVQWLTIGAAKFEVRIQPAFGVQLLAAQFDAEALTLGAEIRSPTGHEWWITPGLWENEAAQIVDYIVETVQPSAQLPLTTEAVLRFLRELPDDHPAIIAALGVAHVVLGELKQGRSFLEKASRRYRQIPVEWAEVEEARIRGWLNLPPDALIQQLQEDARRGAELLGLPAERAL
jgi:hypothetical protein